MFFNCTTKFHFSPPLPHKKSKDLMQCKCNLGLQRKLVTLYQQMFYETNLKKRHFIQNMHKEIQMQTLNYTYRKHFRISKVFYLFLITCQKFKSLSCFKYYFAVLYQKIKSFNNFSTIILYIFIYLSIYFNFVDKFKFNSLKMKKENI